MTLFKIFKLILDTYFKISCTILFIWSIKYYKDIIELFINNVIVIIIISYVRSIMRILIIKFDTIIVYNQSLKKKLIG